MRKVALFVSSSRLESLFRQSKIFSKIKNDYDITVFYFNSESSNVYDGSQKLFAIKSTKYLAKFQKFILDIESYHSSNINVSFESRIRVITNLNIKHDLKTISFIKAKKFYGMCLSIFSKPLLYSPLSSLMRFASDMVPLITNPRLIFTRFELGIVLSGGNFSSMENSVGRLLKFRQIPNLLLVDNWDNLSSKSVLWNKPSKLLVWGENMKEDAVQVHNMKEENVVIAGSYRLIYPPEQGFQTIDKFIYFIGSGLQHSHELEILMHLSVNLSMYGETGIKIVYRPHPFSIRNQKFQYLLQQLSHFSNIQVDSDIILNESNAFYSETSLSHLAQMTLKSDFIIATHSTVIVEALYFGKRVIAFSGAEHGVFSNQNIWDMYTHLKQIKNFSNLTVTVDRINFFQEVLRSLQNTVILEPVNYSAISRNTQNYSEILSEVSFDLISKR
jgi:hypothetical protein